MGKILAIDDQLDNLITVKAVLKMLLPEYEVLTAQSGKQGIQLAKENKPDAILLDIIMPGMDGYETCQLLKENVLTKHIPIVMVTALRTDANSKVKALDLGADSFVSKPIEPIELAAQLKVVLRTKLAEDKLREEKEQLDKLVKERTRVLAESEQKYRSLVESSQNPILVIQDGLVSFANPIAIIASEYSQKELVGSSFIQYLHADDRELVVENYKKRKSGENPKSDFQFRIISKSGKVLVFNFKVNSISWEGEEALLYILHDITERIEYEKQKAQLELRNEILLEIHKKAFELNNTDLYQFVLDKALLITESKIAFFHELNKDQNTIKLTAWNIVEPNKCKAPFETHYPIEKAGNWVDCVREMKPVVYNNFPKSPNQKGMPDGHVELLRFMSIPVTLKDEVFYIFGIGNKEEDYTDSDVENIQIIANEISKILEKRKYERDIKESTERYVAIHNNAPLPFQSLNNDGIIIEVNPAWLKTMGYQKEEVIGQWYGNFLHEDFIPLFDQNFPNLKKKGRVQNVPLRLKKKDGEYIDIKLDGSSAYTSEGDFKQTYCTFKNVTEEVVQQKKLEESEAKYRSFAEHFDGIAFRGFSDHSVDFMNGKVKEITGFEEHDFISGKIWFQDLIHPDDKRWVEEHVAEFLNSDLQSTSRSYRIFTKNKEMKWVNESISKFEEKDNPGVYGVLQDITQIKETNLLLEESNRFNKSLIDTIPFPMEIVNRKGEILFINPVLEKLVGKGKLGGKCWELYKDDKKQCQNCPLQKTIQMGEVYRTEAEGALGGRIFEITHRTMFFNGEEALMEIFVETTERKQFENELIEAKEKAQESDRLKSAFLANMSHEIRTPMNGILGFTSLLQEPGLTGEDQNRYIDIIQSSGNRMLNTVNDIIEISKIETGQVNMTKKRVDASKHMSTLFQFFALEAKNKGLQFILENQIDEKDAVIITDKNKFSSVLTNLIKNAIKFTDRGSLVLGGEKKNGHLEFYVKDSGIGIPENRMEAIFNRFEQADIGDRRAFEGSGLGLAISKSYVEMLGGKMWVESILGEGSTFSFSIPCISANSELNSAQKQTKEKLVQESNKNLNILVAEDDEISKLHLSILLKKITPNIRFAHTGKEAVEMCKQNPEINLIMMDIKMPEMDGYEATRKIREFNQNVIILAQTAFVLEGDKEKALNAGCNDYLSKPIDKNTLKSLIHNYF